MAGMITEKGGRGKLFLAGYRTSFCNYIVGSNNLDQITLKYEHKPLGGDGQDQDKYIWLVLEHPAVII